MARNNQRAKEFLECMGIGKSIYECEAENEEIDEVNRTNRTKGTTKHSQLLNN